jgi:hypothetical protein
MVVWSRCRRSASKLNDCVNSNLQNYNVPDGADSSSPLTGTLSSHNGFHRPLQGGPAKRRLPVQRQDPMSGSNSIGNKWPVGESSKRASFLWPRPGYRMAGSRRFPPKKRNPGHILFEEVVLPGSKPTPSVTPSTLVTTLRCARGLPDLRRMQLFDISGEDGAGCHGGGLVLPFRSASRLRRHPTGRRCVR